MTRATLVLILGGTILALAACGGGKKTPAPTPTASGPTATPTLTIIITTPTEAGTPAATEEPFQGGRDPVEAPAQAAGAPLLVDVRTGAHTDYDRITFEFDGNERPHYRVEYIAQAQVVGCGSGAPVPLTGGAFLQVRFTPANAHNDQGTPTFGQTQVVPRLNTIADAKQTCDFEADVIWVLGLSQELDFRVVELDSPPRIAVDVAHP